jgi:thiol:disulfide interchange protein DsbD
MKLRRCLSLLLASCLALSVAAPMEAAPKRPAKPKPIAAGPKAAKPGAPKMPPGPARLEKKGAVQVEVVTDASRVEAGKPFFAGVHFRIEKEWYIYWQFVGDIGQATSVEWVLPPGFKAGPLRWPVPRTHLGAGDFLNYVYEDEAVLFAEITPPDPLPAGPLAIAAKVSWQMCSAEKCVPAEAVLELPLQGSELHVPETGLFAKWQALVPRESSTPFRVLWDRSKADSFALRVEGLGAKDRVEFFPLPPPDVQPDHPKTGPPAANGAQTITFPVSKGGAPNLPWRGVVAVQKEGGTREGWLVAAERGQPADLGPKPARTGFWGLILKLLAAFLGGLIMNVMPCVLPVIALKIFGFVDQAGEDPKRVFRLGVAFTAGVFAFFLGLAVAVVRLKSAFNWGYQFQNPHLLAALIALVFVFALNLIGVFEITLGGGAATKLNELSGRDGYSGAFLHGLFTTLLGTSCTAPFLAGSLSFATTQSGPVIFLLFIAISAGMSLPYFLLTARPAWLRYVPKPGAWMERVKQGMGFLMLAVAVWLFTVFAMRGAGAMTGMSWFLLALGLACWLFGTVREPVAARIAIVLLPVVGYFVFLHGKLAAKPTGGGSGQAHVTGSIAWVDYSEERLAEGRKAGRPVFVDFTAEWCINCKVYERVVLGNEAVGAKFREKNVLALRADWTNTEDPVVTKALKSFNRVGVPLFVLYRPGETEPVVLDAITTGGVLAELDKARK